MTATQAPNAAAGLPGHRLAAAAFGNHPQSWPLPSATTNHELWLRAVAAGGQGRYATALADLDTLSRQAGGPLLSLAHSTRASFLRQLGWHNLARIADGRAWALAEGAEAQADALVGLAADALGVGRFGAAGRLLERAKPVTEAGAVARQRVRLAWVSAELAMVSGRGEAAVGHAERAVRLAEAVDSPRHAAKSEVVHAAALCSAGRYDDSRTVAQTALARTQQLGLVPLTWALGCLLGDIGSAPDSPQDIAAIRDGAAATVRARGGHWAG